MYRGVVAVDRLVCGIYTTISAEAMEYKPEHGWADISTLEDAEQFDKVSNGYLSINYYLYFTYRHSGERVARLCSRSRGVC